VIDWVQDNMLNPAYFGLCLSLPIVVERLDVHFDVLGCSPAFAEDWRWFKAMAGANRQLHTHLLEEYWRKAHNYLDYRQPPFSREVEANQRLEEIAVSLLAAIEEHEDLCLRGKNSLCAETQVQNLLERFVDGVPAQMSATMAALREFGKRAFDLGSGDINAVVGMESFGTLFGRETSYLSLVRRPMFGGEW
jgi:hypothetical protein